MVDQKEVVERRAQPWVVDLVFVEWLLFTSIPTPEKRVFYAGRRFAFPLRWPQPPDGESEGDQGWGNGNNLPTNLPLPILSFHCVGIGAVFVHSYSYSYDTHTIGTMMVLQPPRRQLTSQMGHRYPTEVAVSVRDISKMDRMR